LLEKVPLLKRQKHQAHGWQSAAAPQVACQSQVFADRQVLVFELFQGLENEEITGFKES
jgi:hypothetical protein